MTESPKDAIRDDQSEQSVPAEQDPSKTARDAEAGPSGAIGEEPGAGGYGDRDPKTEMPRVPGAPETMDEPPTHDAAPDTSDDE